MFDPVIVYSDECEGWMETKLNYPYREIDIRYGDKLIDQWNSKNHKFIDRCIVHEMCHHITAHMFAKMRQREVCDDDIRDAVEEATEHMTRIVIEHVK